MVEPTARVAWEQLGVAAVLAVLFWWLMRTTVTNFITQIEKFDAQMRDMRASYTKELDLERVAHHDLEGGQYKQINETLLVMQSALSTINASLVVVNTSLQEVVTSLRKMNGKTQ
jgi:hypothetical protein